MKTLTESNSYIPLFESRVSHCRRLYDDVVVFERDGRVIGLRSHDRSVNGGDNFYDFTSEAEANLVGRLCNSFEYKWILIDTELGCAAVFNSLYGISGLLFAVIFHARKEEVKAYFGQHQSHLIFPFATVEAASRCDFLHEERKEIEESFLKADSALSYQSITAATYRLGADLGAFLSERITEIADFIGCIGQCKSDLERIPQLENFSPEAFTAISAAVILFARNRGIDRSFSARLHEYKEHLMVSFSIRVSDSFNLYDKHRLSDSLLSACERTAAWRETFFDCSLIVGRERHLRVSFVPESDPLVGRRIKEDVESYISEFWDE